MFFIWGSNWFSREEGRIRINCLICNSDSLLVHSGRRWFTFFFIPIFPTTARKYYMECSACENTYKFKDEINVEELLKRNSFNNQA